ncbi:hypothetical protein R3I94_000732 [Phoxinus phoxinus]
MDIFECRGYNEGSITAACDLKDAHEKY